MTTLRAGWVAVVLMVVAASPAWAGYAGTYAGSYSGDERGTWQFTVSASGSITGYVRDPVGVSYSGTGSVNSSGNMVIKVNSLGVTMRGKVQSSGQVSGTWDSPYYGLSGSFTGQRTSTGGGSGGSGGGTTPATTSLKEDWNVAAVRAYPPATTTTIKGDAGTWYLGDTASEDDCGINRNQVDVVQTGGGKALRMIAGVNDEGCAENIWVARANVNLKVSSTTKLLIAFSGSLEDPQWNGAFPTLVPPAGDEISLRLTDYKGNMLVYIFQRAPDYPPHSTTFSGGGQTVGYREVFVDDANSPGGAYLLDVYHDLWGMPNYTGSNIKDVVFEIDGVGTVTLDTLNIAANQVLPPKQSMLSVSIVGNGTVTPNMDGLMRVVGQSYSMTAKSNTGNLFVNWTDQDGTVLTNHPTLKFKMTENLELTATFVPNPYMQAKGTYTGLLLPTDGDGNFDTALLGFTNSGFFTATVTDKGSYSGKIQLAGKSYAFTGTFDAEGSATKTIPRTKTTPLTLDLQVALDGSQIMTGTLRDGLAWESGIIADLAVFSTANPCPYAGKYTLAFPGFADGGTDLPAGAGYATVSIDSKGKLAASGTLADGTALSQTTVIAKDGFWPLFASLYSGKGQVLGWIRIEQTQQFEGAAFWMKPSSSTAKYFPKGFIASLDALGGIYLPPTATRNIFNCPWTTGDMAFSGGNLTASILAQFNVAAPAKLTAPGLKITTITSASGYFTGTYTLPGTSKKLTFKCVALQLGEEQPGALGYFLGANQSGEAQLVLPGDR